MRLPWNEIRPRAAAFAKKWAGKGYEKGETQLFYRDFFEIFGVPVQRVAQFERPVKALDAGKSGFIDLFWKGVLLVEQKSKGRDLAPAREQARGDQEAGGHPDAVPGERDSGLTVLGGAGG